MRFNKYELMFDMSFYNIKNMPFIVLLSFQLKFESVSEMFILA